tara:strand:+ start:520 stop:750 length:231 start_codon:yes stop_codon:yes gene_type:complete
VELITPPIFTMTKLIDNYKAAMKYMECYNKVTPKAVETMEHLIKYFPEHDKQKFRGEWHSFMTLKNITNFYDKGTR